MNHRRNLVVGFVRFTVHECAGVIGVAVTGLLLDNPSREHEISSGWWQAFAACTMQCIAGSTIFVLFAKGNRLFGSDQDS